MIKAFGLQANADTAFRRTNKKWTGTAFRMHFSGALVEQSAYTGICLVHVAVLGLGAWWAFAGEISIGTLVAFEEMLISTGYALSYVTQYVPTLAQAVGSVRHLAELLEQRPEPADSPDTPALRRLSREIRFRGVSFRYPGGRFRLHVEDLAIQPGALVNIVGPSGSGKSTFLGLLQRFFEPDEGAILFDGAPIAEATRASLRGQTGVVFQESFLVNASVADNIRLGRADATDAEIEAAARAAEIHDVVAALPEGYATVVGERGSRLSGGQRQRVAIARALVRDPTLLILDEPTSALDHETERALMSTLRRLARDRTVINMTHRLGSIDPGDQVVVMERGKVTEVGYHAELMQREGFYATFFRGRRRGGKG